MVYLVNSHTHATRIGWHLWEIDSRFAPGLAPGCADVPPAPRRSQEVQDLSGTSALITDDDKGRAWSLEIQRALGAPELFVPVAVRQMVSSI